MSLEELADNYLIGNYFIVESESKIKAHHNTFRNLKRKLSM